MGSVGFLAWLMANVSARQGSELLNCHNFALTGLWISTTMCYEKSIDLSLGGRAGAVLSLAPSLQQSSFIQSSGGMRARKLFAKNQYLSIDLLQ